MMRASIVRYAPGWLLPRDQQRLRGLRPVRRGGTGVQAEHRNGREDPDAVVAFLIRGKTLPKCQSVRAMDQAATYSGIPSRVREHQLVQGADRRTTRPRPGNRATS